MIPPLMRRNLPLSSPYNMFFPSCLCHSFESEPGDGYQPHRVFSDVRQPIVKSERSATPCLQGKIPSTTNGTNNLSSEKDGVMA